MKNLFLVLIIFLGGVVTSQAQDYNSAIGLRLGYPTSITYKKFVSESNAFEIYGGLRGIGNGTSIRANAAYLIHNELGDTERLKWYYGAGVGVAFYRFNNGFGTGSSNTSLTVSGYIGLEYTLEDVPVSFSLDWNPTYFLGGFGSGFGADGGALAVRYVLGGGD
ncbi:MAG: hypothetical protein ACJA1A_001252 [Saprospiraceae bacterium]|jgi:hypothetical protein|tara:strand:- start:512 stop:1003 length:492 start_codon:yes stop_codon:yes gene_type:complete